MKRSLNYLTTSLLLTTLALPISASAGKVIYKVVDKDGNVTFTSTKPADNVKYEVVKLRTIKDPKSPIYRDILITTPSNDQTVLQDQAEVTVKLALTPPLQPEHKIQLVFNGDAIDVSDTQTNFVLRELESGSHQIQINILDDSENIAGSSAAITIHVQRPTSQDASPSPQ